MTALETPVLLIIFNRPQTVIKNLAALRRVKPRYLFVAADGPRPGHLTDKRRCEEARSAIGTVDWPCEVKTYFRDENRGCGHGPAEAITWFFTQVEQGIILEDDCLPDPSFFPYCTDLLGTYRNDPRIAIISGTNPVLHWRDRSRSYLFSTMPSTWGWATWRRAWEKFDYQGSAWHSEAGKEQVRQTLGSDRYYRHFARQFELHFSEVRPDVWDYQWYFCCLYHGSIGIVPARNLISNIGFDEDATHTFNARDAKAGLPTQPLAFPLTHTNFNIDRAFDWYLFERTLNPQKRSFAKKAVLKTIKTIQATGLF